MTKNIGLVFLALLVAYASPCVAQVTSVSNSDGTLTISPTTGAVVGSLNLGNANTWTAPQTMGDLSVTGTTIDLDVYGAIYEDGSENVAFGEYTFLNSFVTNDTAIGSQTLTNTTGNKNTAVGDWAQHESTSGSYNTSLGFDALYGNTSSSDNTGIGDSALGAANLGSNNTAVGQAALYLSYGANNTAIGAGALYSETSGTNDALGEYAAYYITTGTSNVALGQYAMQGISATPLTGNYNSGIGNSALYDLQSAATEDTALGYEAGEYISSGSNNTAIGYEAMLSTSANPLTGSNNVAVGDQALFTLTGAASDNTAVGLASLPTLTSGSGNTALGYEAGTTATTGTNNIFIGNDTEPGASADTNEIVIGYQATGNGSNTTTIGNSSTTGTYINGGVVGVTGGTAAPAGIVGQVITANCGDADASGTVTFTNASPTVVTWTSKQLTSGVCPVYFTNSGGALPTGVSANTTYYTDPASITTNTFQIATSIANAIAGTDVNTSSSGSGTQTAINSVHGVTTTNIYNGAAVSLTAGNWICWGQGFASTSGNTTALIAQVGTSSATFNTAGGYGSYNTGSWSPTHGYTVNTMPMPFSVSGTTTVYLSVRSDFSSGSDYLTGEILCLRSN
jgi:hypothetical protein